MVSCSEKYPLYVVFRIDESSQVKPQIEFFELEFPQLYTVTKSSLRVHKLNPRITGYGDRNC